LTADLPEQIKFAMQNPNYVADQIARVRAERSLRKYIPLVWDVLEPGRPFVPGRAVDAICEHLEAITYGGLRKLLINVPPGCMKSLLTCVLWPTWEWGPLNLPYLRYLTASYSAGLSIRDNRRARLLIQSEVYQRHWGQNYSLVGDQNAKQKYENTERGFRLATSVGGITTGERADRIVIDDPHNVIEAESETVREEALMWFSEVLPTRVNDPDKSAFLCIMQRVHERDVSGMILAEELGYEHLMLPMEFEEERKCYINFEPGYFENPLCKEVFYNQQEHAWQPIEQFDSNEGINEPPETEMRWEGDWRNEDGELLWEERFSKKHLEEDLKPSLRAWGGTYAEAGQLQQRPSPRGGGMFQKKDFQFIDPTEVPKLLGRTVRGYDLAATESHRAPYTAGVKGMIDQQGRLIILDVERYQKSAGQVKTNMRTTADHDGVKVEIDIPQDPGQAGKAQKADLAKNLHGYSVTFSPETGDKETRAKPVAAQCEGQNMFLVRASWNDPYINELCSFPAGQFKDQTDATSRMYSNLLRKPTATVGFGGKVIE